MRTHAMCLFAAGVILAACSDRSGTGPAEPGQAVVVTSSTGAELDSNGYRLSVNGADSGVIGLQDTVVARLEPGTWLLALTDVSSNCKVGDSASREVTIVSADVVPVDFSVVCTSATGVVRTAVSWRGPDLNGETFGVRVDGALPQEVTVDRPWFAALSMGLHVISVQPSAHCAAVGPEATAVTVGNNPLDTVQVEFPVTCIVPPEKAGIVRITAAVTGFSPDGIRYPVWYSHDDPWGYGADWIALDSLTPGEAMVVRLEASSVDPDHAVYWFRLGQVYGPCYAGASGSVEVPLGDTLDVALPLRCPGSPWDY